MKKSMALFHIRTDFSMLFYVLLKGKFSLVFGSQVGHSYMGHILIALWGVGQVGQPCLKI